MTDNTEIIRTARLLIDEYGELAAMGAVIRADHLSERGDLNGHAIWLQIAKVTEDLLSEEMPAGQSLH